MTKYIENTRKPKVQYLSENIYFLTHTNDLKTSSNYVHAYNDELMCLKQTLTAHIVRSLVINPYLQAWIELSSIVQCESSYAFSEDLKVSAVKQVTSIVLFQLFVIVLHFMCLFEGQIQCC